MFHCLKLTSHEVTPLAPKGWHEMKFIQNIVLHMQQKRVLAAVIVNNFAHTLHELYTNFTCAQHSCFFNFTWTLHELYEIIYMNFTCTLHANFTWTLHKIYTQTLHELYINFTRTSKECFHSFTWTLHELYEPFYMNFRCTLHADFTWTLHELYMDAL